jgi:molybdopterin converting factor small subunit
MTVVSLPTPLRPYAQGQKEISVRGDSVRSALDDLVRQHPGLRPHLFDEQGSLRAYVNIFRNQEDVRNQQGMDTVLEPPDRLLIVPSIAGGAPPEGSEVDYSALRANQAAVIGLVIGAFVADAPIVVGLTGLAMLIGSAAGRPGFAALYRAGRALGRLRPDRVRDNPQPHLFAQSLGGAFLALSLLCLAVGLSTAGWVLAWIVAALAALNLFGGFCVGCALYYWLSRAGVPGFTARPLPGAFPGRQPPAPS